MSIVFLNGQFLPEGEAYIPVTDRGFQLGDGVFTTMCVRNGVAEFVEEHLQRLKSSCEGIHIIPPAVDPDWITEIIKRNKAFTGTWRLKIFISGSDAPLAGGRLCSTLLVTLKPYTNAGKAFYKLGIYPQPCLRPTSAFKTLGYLDRYLIAEYAKNNGFDDALVLTPDGMITETAFCNIFWIDGDTLFYPHPDLPYMPGVMLQAVLADATRSNILVPTHASPSQLPDSAHLFICNSMIGVKPVSSLDRHPKVVFNHKVNPLPILENYIKQ